MLELISRIPENFGWVMIGFAAAVDVFAFVKLVKFVYECRKEDAEVGV